jgi:hypothetical protein
MQVRLKGLKINTDMVTGTMSIGYHYPIKREFYNVFKAAEELLKMNVIEIKKMVKGKEVTKCYCYLNFYGNSNDVIPNFRKAQTELMMLSRRAKIERFNEEIVSLNTVKEFYNK